MNYGKYKFLVSFIVFIAPVVTIDASVVSDGGDSGMVVRMVLMSCLYFE